MSEPEDRNVTGPRLAQRSPQQRWWRTCSEWPLTKIVVAMHIVGGLLGLANFLVPSSLIHGYESVTQFVVFGGFGSVLQRVRIVRSETEGLGLFRQPTAGSGDQAFTPTHLFFLSTTGSDANDGLTPATAWATANHAVSCGDVILVAPGTYSNKFNGFGTVSNCPSTTGGIDGTGGVYFAVLLCAGSDLVSCVANGSAPVFGFSGGNSNWAVEGFVVPNVNTGRAFEVRIVTGGVPSVSHHIASINNVVYNSLGAFEINDEGAFGGSNPPAADYLAVIGTIAQNAVQDNICLGAIDFVGTGASDGVTSAIKGIMYGNFSWSNRNTNCDGLFDNEGMMFDTLDAHNSNGIWVAMNNMIWDSGRYGFQLFWQCSSTTAFTVNVLNNTAFANNAGAVTAGLLAGDIQINANSGCTGFNPIPVTANVLNNIGKSHYATSPSTGFAVIYSFVINVANAPTPSFWTLATNGGTGNENVWKGQQSACQTFNGFGGCDAGNNIDITDRNFATLLGTNFYVDPAFVNETDLLTNRLGAPNCAGFTNVTACMGWNAATQTLTVPSVISDLMPTVHTDKGYQKPSTTCAPNANYPTWLKGVVYLKASGFTSGATITQKADLVTKPCGL